MLRAGLWWGSLRRESPSGVWFSLQPLPYVHSSAVRAWRRSRLRLTSALPWRNGIHPSYATWQTSSIVTIGKPSLVSIIEWIAKPEVDCRVGEGSYCTGKHSNDEIVVMKQIPFQYWAVVAFFICGLVLIGCGQDTSPVEQPDALAEKVDSVSVVSDRGGGKKKSGRATLKRRLSKYALTYRCWTWTPGWGCLHRNGRTLNDGSSISKKCMGTGSMAVIRRSRNTI